MKTLIRVLALVTLSLLTAGLASADDTYPWSNHKNPFTFLFGNDIDSHQQSEIKNDGSLYGYLYIWFTGDTTSDGFKVATHVDCTKTPGCTVGWTLNGEPGIGTYLYTAYNEVGMMDHPVFLADRRDIPEPGAYAHFHWLCPTCDVNGMPTTGELMDGYFLQLTVMDKFCFFHMQMPINPGATCRANGGIPVAPGIDIATHVNIVTSYPGLLPSM
jgi:hypothetical protein